MPLTNWSYDFIFPFRTNIKPDDVIIVYMDEESHRALKQPWFQNWDRSLHAQLIERLRTCGVRAIAFDILFDLPITNNPAGDRVLVEAARSFGNVILAGKLTPVIINGEVVLQTPAPPFDELRAVTVWGLAESGSEDEIIRQHSRGLPNIDTLNRKVAQLVLTNAAPPALQERWINYYGPPGTLPWVSYHQVLENARLASNVFSGKVVYVGALTGVGFTGGKGTDDFKTPYTLWTSSRSPGVEINATVFLNLLHHDFLTRLSPATELLLVSLCGVIVGVGLTFLRSFWLPIVGVVLIGSIYCISYVLAWHNHLIFSWIVVGLIQVPVGVFCSIIANTRLLMEKNRDLQIAIARQEEFSSPVVQFTVTSAAVSSPKPAVEIVVWVHPEGERDEILRRSKEASFETEIITLADAQRSSSNAPKLSARLRIEGITEGDLEEEIIWNRNIAKAKFHVEYPRSKIQENHSGLAAIYAQGMKVATLHFSFSNSGKSVAEAQSGHRKAFACYSSADRDQVLARIQGMQKAMPKLEVFIDVLSLRAGQNWEEELKKAIRSCDCFYLFWSKNASSSKEVEKEWKCALEERGPGFIDPVPLVSPEEAPPPPELCNVHFNDWTLAFRRMS
jgi:CHASE2 domain-containing sensor protein